MKKHMMTMVAVMIMAVALVPLNASAMKHGDDAKMSEGMQHGDMKMDGAMEMDGDMKMNGDMIMLHGDEVDGTKVMAHLMDVKEAMAEHGMKMTHHFMVGFKNAAGEDVEEGRVAVKIKRPDGTVSEAIPMMAMAGEFGADITLDQKGMYHFMVGTKLEDGQKRTFNLQYEVK